MNSDPEFNEQKGDKAYINTLLIRLFEIEELASHDELSRGKLNIIKGSPKFMYCAEYIAYICQISDMFKLRTLMDTIRFDRFEHLVESKRISIRKSTANSALKQ